MQVVYKPDLVKKRVSDLITTDEVRSWVQGDVILIAADTGSGKSHLVKNTLHDRLAANGMKCLYLLPRLRTKEQFELEMSGDDTIKFMTYQAVESIIADPNASIGKWDVVVADEAHYFLADSSFNHRTDTSFGWIMEQENAIRVFMTATPEGIERYFDMKKIMFTEYYLHYGYPQIQDLTFFWQDAQLDSLAQQIIDSGNKGLFFIQSAEKALALYKRFKDRGMFLCSRYNQKYARHLDNKLISNMLETEQFDCTLLFTTMVLDTGVNLKDRLLTDIVIDVADPTSIIQCIGRKRFVDDTDFANLYIHAKSNRQVAGMIKALNDDAASVKDLLEKGAIAYNAANRRGNDDTGLIFDAPDTTDNGSVPLFRKEINELKYAHLLQSIETYREMLELGENGYIKYIAQLLNRGDYEVLEAEDKMRNLTEYLDSLVGTPILTARDREPLIERLDIRRDGHLCKRYGVLAAWLEDSRLPYRLLEYSANRIVDGKRRSYRAWEIVKLAA